MLVALIGLTGFAFAMAAKPQSSSTAGASERPTWIHCTGRSVQVDASPTRSKEHRGGDWFVGIYVFYPKTDRFYAFGSRENKAEEAPHTTSDNVVTVDRLQSDSDHTDFHYRLEVDFKNLTYRLHDRMTFTAGSEYPGDYQDITSSGTCEVIPPQAPITENNDF
jgi:hypothetical protein